AIAQPPRAPGTGLRRHRRSLLRRNRGQRAHPCARPRGNRSHRPRCGGGNTARTSSSRSTQSSHNGGWVMKGKNERARHRRGGRTAAAVERLRTEIEAEARRARTAHNGAAQARTARARLAQETTQSKVLLAALTSEARQLAAAVGPGWDAIAAALADLRTIKA